MTYLTTPEAAAYTRRHQETLLLAARRGEVRSAQRVPHGPRRYRQEWLDDWVAGVKPRRLAVAKARST